MPFQYTIASLRKAMLFFLPFSTCKTSEKLRIWFDNPPWMAL